MEITAVSVVPALATLVAAFVAGGIARSNLIVSKESKISEFRQAWIGELRENLSTLFSAVRLIARAVQDERDKELGNESNPKFHFSQEKIVETRYSSLETKYRIELLLDAKRDNHAELRRLLDAMMTTQYQYLSAGNNADIEPVFEAVGRANEHSTVVLAHEWEMVRKGEDDYRSAVKMANSVLLVAGVLMAAIAAVAFFSPAPTVAKATVPLQQANQTNPVDKGASMPVAPPIPAKSITKQATEQQVNKATPLNNEASQATTVPAVISKPGVKPNDVDAAKK